MKYNKKIMKGIYKRIVNSMSGLKDIEVGIQANVVPHFNLDKNKIMMPEAMPFAETEEDNFQFSRGTMVHESSHVLFAPNIINTKIYEQEGICPKDFAEWFNVFADLNNEYKVAQVFPNLGKPLSDKTEALFKKKPEMLKSDNPFMQVLMRCDKLASIKPEYPIGYNPELIKFVDETVRIFNKRKIESCKGRNLCIFTDQVFLRWVDLCEKHKKGSMAAQNKAQALKKQLGQAIKSGNKGQIKNIEGKLEELSKSGNSWFKNTNTLTRTITVVKENLSEEDLEDLKEIIRNKCEKEKKQQQQQMSRFFSRSPGEMTQLRPDGSNRDKYDKSEAISKGKVINRALRNKIKLQEDFEKKHRSGEIIDLDEVSRQISKAGRIYKPNIFQRKNTFSRGGEWAIEVMCDCSGSMSGLNMSQAKQSLATLAYALNNLPNVHYALTGFDEAQGYNEYQIKKFNDKSLKAKYLDKVEAGGGTPIETAVFMGTKRLVMFKNMKKILVIITDGCGNKGKTTENVKIAERMQIKVLGIGINGNTIKDSFKDHYIYQDTSNLDKDLTRLILERLNGRKVTRYVKRIWER